MNRSQKRYRARHILLSDIEDAEYILEQLESGKKFDDLAKEFSECDSSQKGGSLGVFSSGEMLPEFERALFRMKEGDISRPIRTKYGLHIIEKLKV